MPSASVVGAGHNGLSAAITLARAGVQTTLYEAMPEVGGLARSVTIDGFTFDVGASIVPMSLISPALRQWPLAQHGARWITSPLAVAHAFDPTYRPALAHELDVETDEILDSELCRDPDEDTQRWKHLLSPLLDHPELSAHLLFPQPNTRTLREFPTQFAQFGLRSLRSAHSLARHFSGQHHRMLWLGMCAHGNTSLHAPGSAATGLPLSALTHTCGWPLIEGGTGTLMLSMRRYLEHLGGKVVTGQTITHLDDLPERDLILLDTSPRQAQKLLGASGAAYARLTRGYRAGKSVYKTDYALSGPLPWRCDSMKRSAALHLGIPGENFAVAAQTSLFDPSRAPAGQHTLWMYGQRPPAEQETLLDAHAPGWRDLILQRHVTDPATFGAISPLAEGGDILSGETGLWQMLARPWAGQHRTNLGHVFLCSAASVPGPGIHGMGGHNAARLGLQHLRQQKKLPRSTGEGANVR